MIRGRLVGIRPVSDEDVPLIHRWMNHPDVWRYMDYERPFSLADVRDDVERSRAEGFPFTIVVAERPIGRIGLNRFSRRDRRCGMYMFVGEPAYWGKGYARDAVLTLLTYAFDRWDLHQVELWTLADNDRAIRSYEACGFVVEGTLRQRSFKEGRWVDHAVLSVNREELERARTAWEAASGRREGVAAPAVPSAT
jgi:RimJ/RimL family protein N-acetyltransferase